jgi:hypothetical protein
MRDNFKGLGIAVSFTNKEDWNRVKETLSRIGIESKTDRILYQSCHILRKVDKESGVPSYRILHFKELFMLDGRDSIIPDQDILRRNKIAALMAEWGLCEIKTEGFDEFPKASMAAIKIIPYSEKQDWHIVQKYNIGKNRKNV